MTALRRVLSLPLILWALAPFAWDRLRFAWKPKGGYRGRLRVVDELAAELREYEEFNDGPFVCPGCHCVGAEPHAADCIDEEIREIRESREDDGDRDHGAATSDWEFAE